MGTSEGWIIILNWHFSVDLYYIYEQFGHLTSHINFSESRPHSNVLSRPPSFGKRAEKKGLFLPKSDTLASLWLNSTCQGLLQNQSVMGSILMKSPRQSAKLNQKKLLEPRRRRAPLPRGLLQKRSPWAVHSGAQENISEKVGKKRTQSTLLGPSNPRETSDSTTKSSQRWRYKKSGAMLLQL